MCVGLLLPPSSLVLNRGRGMETPGEDPYLSGKYAIMFVKGMQEGEDERYLKTISTVGSECRISCRYSAGRELLFVAVTTFCRCFYIILVEISFSPSSPSFTVS